MANASEDGDAATQTEQIEDYAPATKTFSDPIRATIAAPEHVGQQTSAVLALALVGFGLVVIYLIYYNRVSRPEMLYILSGFALLLIGSGIALMVIGVRSRPRIEGQERFPATPSGSDLGLAITQLSKNYALVRSQTLMGFLIAAITLLVGAAVIMVGAFGQLFGLTASGVNLTSVAGVVTEFISGSAIVFFKLSFDRLNAASDRLLQTWITMSALQQADRLPDKDRSQLMIELIRELAKAPGSH